MLGSRVWRNCMGVFVHRTGVHRGLHGRTPSCPTTALFRAAGPGRLASGQPKGPGLRQGRFGRTVAPAGGAMRAYLVVMDETRESQAALRYAARRAARTGGAIELLALIPPQEFSQWGGVQAAMEEETQLRAEALVAKDSSAIVEEAGLTPSITVRTAFEQPRDGAV